MSADQNGLLSAEMREAPEAVRRQASLLRQPLTDLVERCRRMPPRVVVTCARGSSAHAATFGKHLIERHLGIPVAAAAPNIASVYHQSLRLQDQLLLTISQSGRSDDLIEFATMARAAGALTVSIVNDLSSPLAAVSEISLPMAAGPEVSVAATKSFVTTLSALLRLTAAWAGDDALRDAIDRLPDRLAEASEVDWSCAVEALSQSSNLVTVGRGPTLAIAREAALKFKEICDLQAEPFSSAEFQHGPMALVAPSYPVLLFRPNDEAAGELRKLADALKRKGAEVLITDQAGLDQESAVRGVLPIVPPDCPETDAVCLIQSFYEFALQLAECRRVDFERPRHLQKVTRTR
jgi:glucosamine--fructose-6-phosphate aminotransferase (isomerizing)